MSKPVRASNILEKYRKSKKGRSSQLILHRLAVADRRRRLDRITQQRTIENVQNLAFKISDLKSRFDTAQAGGFEGNLLDFFKDPQTAQSTYQLGLDKIQAGEMKPPTFFGDIFEDMNILGDFSISDFVNR